MSQRDEILEAISNGLAWYTPSTQGVYLKLQALFAEKPWLANALLPEGSKVCQWILPEGAWCEVGQPLTPEA
jgi:hypothetical protein